MYLSRHGAAGLLIVLAFASTARLARTEVKPNPYESIVSRNVFSLKPPLPNEAPPPPPPPPAPVAKVALTGVTSMFGKTSKRAMLEITEAEIGKPAVTRKPILREGERDGTIEVVSIDVPNNLVKIRNAGVETNITFEVQKSPAAPAGVPGLPGIPPAPAAAFNLPNPAAGGGIGPAPTVISPGGAINNSAGRGGVTLLSAGNPAAPNPGVAPAATSYNPAAAAANVSVSGNSGSGITTLGGGTANSSYPSRQLRTDNAGGTSQPKTLTQEQLSRLQELRGPTLPPLPPINRQGPADAAGR